MSFALEVRGRAARLIEGVFAVYRANSLLIAHIPPIYQIEKCNLWRLLNET